VRRKTKCPKTSEYWFVEKVSKIILRLFFRSTPLGRMISSCPNYLHADVSDGEDLSHHQQEVTGGQLVTLSLVPGTVDSNVASECHLCCPSLVPGARQAEGL